MTRIVWGILYVCAAASAASAGVVKGKVSVDGSEVYLITKDASVRVSGDATQVDTTAGRLAAFLKGEQVELEGRVTPTEFGATILPTAIRSPRFARITATVKSWNRVRWRGQDYPATGLVTRLALANTNFEAFLFGDPKKPDRIHIARAQVRHKGKLGYIRDVEFDSFTVWVPLPPGNPTVFWHSEWHEADVETAAGKVIATEVDLDDLTFVQGSKPEGADKQGAKDRVEGLFGGPGKKRGRKGS